MNGARGCRGSVLVVDSIMEFSEASKVGRKILVDSDIDVKRLPRG